MVWCAWSFQLAPSSQDIELRKSRGFRLRRARAPNRTKPIPKGIAVAPTANSERHAFHLEGLEITRRGLGQNGGRLGKAESAGMCQTEKVRKIEYKIFTLQLSKYVVCQYVFW